MPTDVHATNDLTDQPSTDRAGYPAHFSDLQVDVFRARGIPPHIVRDYRLAVYNGDALTRNKKDGAKGYGTLPVIEGVTGIVIPYPSLKEYSSDISEWDGRATYHRVRLDVTRLPSEVEGGTIITEGKDLPRYLAPAKVKVQPFMTWPAMAAREDVSVPLVFTEAPLKALSVLANLGMAAIGLGGVSAGFKSDGQLTEVLRRAFVWTGRTVYIAYDAGMATNPLVAKGAASLALLLLDAGADVRLVRLPFVTDEYFEAKDQGPDDYIANNGADALRTLFDEAENADPVARVSGNKVLAYKLLDDLYTCAVLTESPYKASQYPTVGGIGAKSVNQKLKEFQLKMETSAPKGPPLKLDGMTMDDIGLAGRLVRHLGGKGEYVPEWETWMVYADGQWIKDSGGLKIQREAKLSTHQIVEEAAEACDDQRSYYESFLDRARSERGLAAAVKLSRDIVATSPEAYLSNPKLLNLANGAIDLETGELSPHKPEHRMAYKLRMEFDPLADTSRIDKFLERVQPDPEVRAYLWRLLGYSITGLIREHVLPIHYGTGRNGKGTLLNAVLSMVGDLGCTIPEEVLTVSKGQQHPTAIATLFGKRFAVASEVNQGDTLNVARVKRLTGGDPLSARFMRGDFFTFVPTHHLQLMLNDRPRVPNATDKALWSRVHCIPWEVVVPDSEQDRGLLDALRTDQGLLRRLVEGAQDYFRVGLCPPEIVRIATTDYQTSEDRYADWIDECVEPAEGHQVTVQDLYEHWSKWSEKRGMKPEAYTTFSKALESRSVGVKIMGGPRKKTAARAGVRLATGVAQDLSDVDYFLEAAGVPSQEELDAEAWADRQVLLPH